MTYNNLQKISMKLYTTKTSFKTQKRLPFLKDVFATLTN